MPQIECKPTLLTLNSMDFITYILVLFEIREKQTYQNTFFFKIKNFFFDLRLNIDLQDYSKLGHVFALWTVKVLFLTFTWLCPKKLLRRNETILSWNSFTSISFHHWVLSQYGLQDHENKLRFTVISKRIFKRRSHKRKEKMQLYFSGY